MRTRPSVSIQMVGTYSNRWNMILVLQLSFLLLFKDAVERGLPFLPRGAYSSERCYR